MDARLIDKSNLPSRRGAFRLGLRDDGAILATDAASGHLWTCAKTVGPARDGGVAHHGGAAEEETYADV